MSVGQSTFTCATTPLSLEIHFLLAETLDLLNNYPPLPQLLSSNYQFPVSMNFVSLDSAHDRIIYYFVTDLFLLV